MVKKINITEVRNRLLSLPEELMPEEIVDVVRHGNVVLRISKPHEELLTSDPFSILDKALMDLPRRLKKIPPKDLAAHHKRYLYAKKNRRTS